MKKTGNDTSKQMTVCLTFYFSLNADGKAHPPLSEIPSYMKIYANGTVMWQGDTVVSINCDITLNAFPSDIHDCFICFGSKTYNRREMQLVWSYLDEQIGSFIENKEWEVTVLSELTKQYHCNRRFQEKTSGLTIQFTLKRKVIAYHITFFVPCFFLSVIMILVFIVPTETGERVNLIVTVLLTIIIFQQLTLDIIPPYSLPILSQYYFFSLTLAFVSALFGIIITNIYYRPRRCLPEKLHTVLIEWLGRLVYMTRNYYNFATGEYDIDYKDVQTTFEQLQKSQTIEGGSENNAIYSHSSEKVRMSSTRISNALPTSIDCLRKRRKSEAIKLLIKEVKKSYSIDDFEKEAEEIEKIIQEQVNKYQVYRLVRVLDRLFLFINFLLVLIYSIYCLARVFR